MIKVILSSFLFFCFNKIFSQNFKNVIITFKNFSNSEEFILSKNLVSNSITIDTIKINPQTNFKDSFNYTIKDSSVAFYKISNENLNFFVSFIADSNVQITKGSLVNEIIFKPSKESILLNKYFDEAKNLVKILYEKSKQIDSSNNILNPSASIKYKNEYRIISDSITNHEVNTFFNNSDKILSLYIATRLVNYRSLSFVDSVMKVIHPNLKGLSLYKELIVKYNERKKTEKFEYLPQVKLIKFNDGKEFKINNNNNKLLLIDFWGSWCAPCINDIPKIKKIQKEFKNYIEIIGIASEFKNDSLEFKKKLLGFNLKWNTVMTYYDEKINNLPSLLKVNIFPTYLIVDKNSKILLRTTELENVISFLKKYN